MVIILRQAFDICGRKYLRFLLSVTATIAIVSAAEVSKAAVAIAIENDVLHHRNRDEITYANISILVGTDNQRLYPCIHGSSSKDCMRKTS